MTWLQWYALIGIPALLLTGAYVAVRLSAHDDRRAGPAE